MNMTSCEKISRLSEAHEMTLNNLAIAQFHIQKLRDEILRLDYSIAQSNVRQQSLNCEAKKLHQQAHELDRKCILASVELKGMESNINQSEVEIINEIDRLKKKYKAVQKSNAILREKLKAKEKKTVKLKSRLSLISSWNVRT
ncbi:predicted protein [Nematostella vectensis]|uniref:Uncharacterized protein n=1 Tax=Nematostella vectensis TaxID=45351 RepID=A7RF30_NEMVE|nr:predicted protein [Nematostella vectensis]|eukprot:XP_001641954.1 predicted protein [Nematostella vectensis]